MDLSRYNRQMILPDFGILGQEKLARSSVLVIGAGGLGCSVLQILVSTGIGKIGVADFDVVAIHNLHRQFLYEENDIGKYKTLVAEERLQKMNAETEIFTFNQKITAQNIEVIISDFDVVVDCTDNFATRYLINDACCLMKKPLVYASIFRYEGQVAVFNVQKEKMITNYRDLFPVPPSPDEVPNCNEAGVLPTLSSIVGAIQANEVIKLLAGLQDVLVHQLLIFNSKNYETVKINFKESKKKTGPTTMEELKRFDYGEFCGINKDDEIVSFADLNIFVHQKNAVLVDVREVDEQPKLSSIGTLGIPLGALEQNFEKLLPFEHICFICASGIRSRKALEIAKSYFQEKEIKHFLPGAKSIVL